jgi:hypothetical protein
MKPDRKATIPALGEAEVRVGFHPSDTFKAHTKFTAERIGRE